MFSFIAFGQDFYERSLHLERPVYNVIIEQYI